MAGSIMARIPKNNMKIAQLANSKNSG